MRGHVPADGLLGQRRGRGWRRRLFRREVGLVQRLGVGEASLGDFTHELPRSAAEVGRVGVVEHDLVAALAVDLVGRDMDREELGL